MIITVFPRNGFSFLVAVKAALEPREGDRAQDIRWFSGERVTRHVILRVVAAFAATLEEHEEPQ
jgi:hypothetical protein